MENGLISQLAPDRRSLVDLVAVLVLTTVALFAFQSSYGGVFFLVVGVVAAVVGVTIAHVTISAKWAWPFGAFAAAIVYLTVIGAVALPDRSIGGFVPTIGSASAAARMAVTGWRELLTTTTPVGRTGDLMAIPALSGLLSGFAATMLARRVERLPLAILPPFVLLGVAIAAGLQDPVSIVLHGIGMLVVTVGWLSYREHRRRPLVESGGAHARRLISGGAVLAIAGVGGLLISDSLPGATANARSIWRPIVPEFDPQQYPSPLGGYREYVKAADCRSTDPAECQEIPEEERDPVMFTVEGLPLDVPVRLATMDEYDGLVWRVAAPGNREQPLLRSGAFERIGAEVEPEFPGETAEVAITIGEYNDVWVPDVGEVISLRFAGSAGGAERDRRLTEAFRYNQVTDTAASPLRLEQGDRYEMTVRLPVVLDELTGEEISRTVPGIGNNRQVSEIANRLGSADLLVIGDDGARLDFVRDLMFRFGTYSDGDVLASQIRASAGHSAYRLTEFVQEYPTRPLIGNAEQFASTYALLFRDIGDLPTRVVMGFMPSASSLDVPVEVRATEVEAWVELPFVEHGWVAILPTPPRDQTSIQTSSPQQPEPDYRTQNPPPPPLIDPEFDQAATRSGQAQATVDVPQVPGPIDPPPVDTGLGLADGFARPLTIVGLAFGSPIVIALLATTVIVLIKRRRRKRRKTVGRAHERIANGWREVTDFAIDTGRVVPTTTTRREAAALVGADTRALAERADAAVWNTGEPDEAEIDSYWTELEAALNGMRSELSPLDRIKTTVSLQSLRRRRGGAPNTTSGRSRDTSGGVVR